MLLITKEQKAKLVANHEANYNREKTIDFKPVVKFFNPCGAGTWLITELNPDTNIMFGLCDIGYPELGYVDLNELKRVRLPFGLSIERDAWFEADKTLSQYADDARIDGSIAA